MNQGMRGFSIMRKEKIINLKEYNKRIQLNDGRENDIGNLNDIEEIKSNKRVQDMKKEYKKIPVPSELKSKVEEAIMREKNENKRGSILKVTRNTGIVAAAAMLSLVVLTNSSPSLAYAMENIPVIGAIAKVVTFRTYTDKTENHEAKIDIPKIETEGENQSINDASQKVNKSVKEYTDMLIKQYNEDIKENGKENYYGMDSSYKVVTNNDRIFTLRIDTVVSKGGSANFSKFYHINKNTGKVFELKDLFKENADYITVISDNIKKQMLGQMAADESKSYFYNEADLQEENFNEIKPDQNFYFNDKDELVIVFDEYEVAPGYMGMVEFTIPSEVTSSIIN